MYSAVGALVCAQSLRREVRVSIAASGWAGGVYVVRTVARDGAQVARFVKVECSRHRRSKQKCVRSRFF